MAVFLPIHFGMDGTCGWLVDQAEQFHCVGWIICAARDGDEISSISARRWLWIHCAS
jgi:hypothetical protein